MKKYLNIALTILVLTTILFSCKKTGTPAPKDYTISIVNKNWSGSLTNNGEQIQYYSVHFNADKTFEWSQWAGDYFGVWSVDGNKITLRFTGINVIVAAEISDDNKLINITTNTLNKVNTGQLIENIYIALDNTLWKGPEINLISGFNETLQLRFMTGTNVEINLAGTIQASHAYNRTISGAIRDGRIFGVITGPNEMRGTDLSIPYHWQAIKQ
jgi:hypothetical protein